LAPFATERIVHSGSEAHLDANKALHLTMALHELATNAVKYGALSNEQGRIQVSWSIAGGALLVDWREMDGPAVRPPGQKGFGSVLIEEVGEGQLEFAAEGVRCKLPILLNG
jgi:two-component sensor histidine kinase